MANQSLRVDAERAHERATTGGALLVCAYEDEAKCQSIRLPDSLTYQEFQQRKTGLDRGAEVIFYCA